MDGYWDRFLILILLILASYVIFLKRKHYRFIESLKSGSVIGQIAFEKTVLGMAAISPELKHLEINPSYCDIMGYSKDELMKMTQKDLLHSEEYERNTILVRDLFAGKADSFQTINRYIHKDGHIIWGRAIVSLVRDGKNNPKFLINQIHDITASKKTEEILQNAKIKAETLASIDYLTGCLNRRAFMKRIEEELARAKRNQTNLSLILVDIDNFKLINDLNGHLAGDFILQRFTECLNKGSRAYDFIGRFGGEEFIICLPDTELQDAFLIAERMRQDIEEMTSYYEDILIKVTGSFGVACSTFESEDPINSLIARADQAMYKAKSLKNRVYKSA